MDTRDTLTVILGPIRGLRDRRRLRDYSPSTYQSQVVAGIRDLEAQTASLIPGAQKPTLLGEQLGIGTSASVTSTTPSDKVAPPRRQQARTVDGVNFKIITGTGFSYAWTLREEESMPTNGPADPAGPLQPGRQLTLTNTLGNIIAFCCNDNVKVWILRYADDDVPAWVEASEGEPHPEIDGLRGYGLSMRNPRKPSWVKLETLQQYRSEGKRKAVQTGV